MARPFTEIFAVFFNDTNAPNVALPKFFDDKLSAKCSLNWTGSASPFTTISCTKHWQQRQFHKVLDVPMNVGHFMWPREIDASRTIALTQAQFDALVIGLPGQRLPKMSVIARL